MLFRTRPNRPDLDATKVPSALDIAWAAGIYEGEGCARLCGRGKRSFAVHVVQKEPQTNALDFLSGENMLTVSREQICTRLALHYEAHFKTVERENPEYRRLKHREKYATNEAYRNKAKASAAKQRAIRKAEHSKVVSIA